MRRSLDCDSNVSVNTPEWQSIRALRAVPTGLAAADAHRRRTFAAALRQAQELANAAQVAGYAAKPLPLFYSLSQAGRAIAAAHLPGQWVLRGHGLRIRGETPDALLRTVVEPAGTGSNSFTGVATAVGSPVLHGGAELGALWAANPDLLELPIPAIAGAWPRALEVPISFQNWSDLGESESDYMAGPVTTEGTWEVSVDLPGETGREIAEAVKSYPTLGDVFAMKQGTQGTERAGPDDRVSRGADGRGVMRVHLAVEVPTNTNRAYLSARSRATASVVEIDERHPQYPPPLVGFALPDIAGGPSPFPLLLWWALLLGLSSLARYEPAAWAAAIDLDSSELAVSLERVLDVASERVPMRILRSLQPTHV
jgi:hypothetical protein